MSTAQPISIPRNLLFRYRFRCPRMSNSANQGPAAKNAPETWGDFGEASELPVLGAFEGQLPFAQVKCGWNDENFFLGVAVRGKQQSIWTRPGQPLESDGVQLWIDTRDTHNVHRATRYCHWFFAVPGVAANKPSGSASTVTGGMLKINRAKEDSPTINRGKPIVQSTVVAGGYDMFIRIPANLLNGWDPADQPSLGFHFAVADREMGWNSLTVGPDLPVAEDPSLWSTLELIEKST